MIQFTIPGQPVAKGRPRFRTVKKKGGGEFTATYTPEKTASYENLVAWTAQQAMAGRALLEAPINLRIVIGLQIPASWSKRKRCRTG